MKSWFRRALVLVAAAAPAALAAQMGLGPWWAAQAIAVVTWADPIPGGGGLTEARVVQPMVMLGWRGLAGHLQLQGTIDLEGATIPDGELAPGAWGEGFYDRRHPHTTVHELMVSGMDLLGRAGGPVRVSLSAGKGFAPFGSDDPMSRPIARYPINHHLAQILERAVALVGIRTGPVLLEAGVFNGDEPERPGQWPRWQRFGDSWSGRLTLLPVRGLELSVSRAGVHSPEHRPGAGTDAEKWHAGGRIERAAGPAMVYALAEWARTTEADGRFQFRSVLVEAAVDLGRKRIYYRFEQSDRPEDQRELDPFRSVRPNLENSILGITRFTLHTAGLQYLIPVWHGRIGLRPFLEGTLGTARNDGGGVLTPEILYGSEQVRQLSGGLRIGYGMAGHRMGRYGGLLPQPASHSHPGM
mgnify:FL=1